MLYVLAGAGCFFANDIYVLLGLRALLGVSVGLIMPLSTGLLAYYYPPEKQAGLGLQATTLIMVGLDLFAFFVGLVFGQLMNLFREPIKYFAPVLFLIGYILFVSARSSLPLLVGAVFTGFANGVGVPYLNTIASIKGGHNSATTVMPLLSAALYLGQFLSPVIVTPLSRLCFGDNDVAGCYKIGIGLCVIFLVQVYTTRHYQSLPPKSE